MGARPHVRRRGGEPVRRVPSRGVPGAGRRATRRGRLPEQSRLPRLLQGVGGRRARGRRRRGVLGRAGVDGAVARRRRRPDALELHLRPLRGALRRPGACRAHTRSKGVPRVVGRRLLARDAGARRGARRQEHRLPSAVDRRAAGDLRLEHGRVASGVAHLRHRPVLEALERAGGSVRPPLREAAPRDVRAARRRVAALAAELRPHRG